MDKLKSCPFCGGDPEIKHVGNKLTKDRKIIVKCTTCRTQRTDATIRYDFEWLEAIASKIWNNRFIN